MSEVAKEEAFDGTAVLEPGRCSGVWLAAAAAAVYEGL